ncbi:helix-turn-helix transcriptional regulator [Schinkia azotoformans]|uniref:helix-turn-helix transcriptional regulator n=1 Tax=Schinkia azotoformans TaxID=1454 RepID=UPI002DBCA440|nr:helix-turn-helix transcriptional regulator [Schinkia azotoformans]MEC1780055.1 helix-turn-helix transcriptional regulator [Schinkia azotoformans]MED4330866.1 helix-turn-helix transcriptional regulator [Schinkia azotoformans]
MSKIKKLRILNEITQERLAEMVGVSQSYLSLLERNKVAIPEELDKKFEAVFKESFEIIDT